MPIYQSSLRKIVNRELRRNTGADVRLTGITNSSTTETPVSEASSTDRSHYETLLLERAEDDVLVVKFNRPEATNAVDAREAPAEIHGFLK